MGDMTDPKSCQHQLASAWQKSIAMLQEGMKTSTAEWHIIVTHYQPESIFNDPEIKRLDKQYGIDLIMGGHTHFQKTGVTDYGVTWILTGGGGGTTTDGDLPQDDGRQNSYGFIDLKVN